jgi:hypothetical protein
VLDILASMNEQHPYSSDSACGVTSYTSVAFWDSVWSDLMCYFHQCRLYRPHRNGWALVIIFLPLLLFFVQKFRGVLLFISCIKFGHNFLIIVCFVFNFFYWFFSSNFPLIIWFHLNFISNIVLIFFIDVFFLIEFCF